MGRSENENKAAKAIDRSNKCSLHDELYFMFDTRMCLLSLGWYFRHSVREVGLERRTIKFETLCYSEALRISGLSLLLLSGKAFTRETAMKFDASLLVHDLGQMPALARFADEAGFDGIWTFETAHEPFLPLVLAAEHSRELESGNKYRRSIRPQSGDLGVHRLGSGPFLQRPVHYGTRHSGQRSQ